MKPGHWWVAAVGARAAEGAGALAQPVACGAGGQDPGMALAGRQP